MSEPESELQEEQAAAAEAARIGGQPSELPPNEDEAQRPLDEAGGGESEGFELAEQELIEHASHGDEHAARRAAQDRSRVSEDRRAAAGGEADTEASSEVPGGDR
jgi:hypothetical protein